MSFYERKYSSSFQDGSLLPTIFDLLINCPWLLWPISERRNTNFLNNHLPQLWPVVLWARWPSGYQNHCKAKAPPFVVKIQLWPWEEHHGSCTWRAAVSRPDQAYHLSFAIVFNRLYLMKILMFKEVFYIVVASQISHESLGLLSVSSCVLSSQTAILSRKRSSFFRS